MLSPNQLKDQLKELTEKTLKTLSEKGPEKAKALKAMLDQYGGVAGLMQAAKDPELKKKIGTWVEDGKKFVLSQEQVQKFLGNERVKAIAEKISSTPDQVTRILAEVLPPLIEKLDAASKRIPEGSFVAKILDRVKGMLGTASQSHGHDHSHDKTPGPQ